MLPDNSLNFPLNHDDPLSFIDHAILALVQVHDVYDLNEVLSALLAEDVTSFVQDHKEMFSVLSGTINNKIRETVFDVSDITFPDGLLMIPPLFKQLIWDTQPDTWQDDKARYEKEFSENPCLTYTLALLFINAMSSDMESAIQRFENDIESLADEDHLHAERYLENLQYFGWPAESVEHKIAQ